MAKEKKVREKKAKAAPKERGPRVPKIRGFDYTSVITFGSGYDGKDNNPKRAKAAARFALYKDGMTIHKALAAGVKVSDISYDTKKGFIKLSVA